MHKTFLKIGALLAAVSIGLGAFAAHALKDLVSDKAVEIFDTGAKYMFYHAIALILTGILYGSFRNKFILWAGRFFAFGILLFIGSLLYISYTQAVVTPMMKWVGPITPLGGLLFILGWLCLCIGFFIKPKSLKASI